MSESEKIATAMVIDDREIDQMLYKRILLRSGAVENVISFLSPEKALEYLSEERDTKVDVIFLDVNMPRMNGFQFLDAATTKLGRDFSPAVVVMLTTSQNAEDRERAKKFSTVKGFLNKPLTEEDIYKVARMLKEM